MTLGRYSMNLLIDPKLKITQVRGQHIRKSGMLFLPTFHPSAVLRDNNLLPDFRRDLAIARKLSEQADEPVTARHEPRRCKLPRHATRHPL